MEIIERKALNFLDLASILGGIISSMLIVFRLVVIPFIDHSFIILAISDLFFSETNNISISIQKTSD